MKVDDGKVKKKATEIVDCIKGIELKCADGEKYGYWYWCW